jgi:hypothetical protein
MPGASGLIDELQYSMLRGGLAVCSVSRGDTRLSTSPSQDQKLQCIKRVFKEKLCDRTLDRTDRAQDALPRWSNEVIIRSSSPVPEVDTTMQRCSLFTGTSVTSKRSVSALAPIRVDACKVLLKSSSRGPLSEPNIF